MKVCPSVKLDAMIKVSLQKNTILKTPETRKKPGKMPLRPHYLPIFRPFVAKFFGQTAVFRIIRADTQSISPEKISSVLTCSQSASPALGSSPWGGASGHQRLCLPSTDKSSKILISKRLRFQSISPACRQMAVASGYRLAGKPTLAIFVEEQTYRHPSDS